MRIPFRMKFLISIESSIDDSLTELITKYQHFRYSSSVITVPIKMWLVSGIWNLKYSTIKIFILLRLNERMGFLVDWIEAEVTGSDRFSGYSRWFVLRKLLDRFHCRRFRRTWTTRSFQVYRSWKGAWRTWPENS